MRVKLVKGSVADCPLKSADYSQNCYLVPPRTDHVLEKGSAILLCYAISLGSLRISLFCFCSDNLTHRKYHRGHVVEGQWVFGGIEEDSRKCFIAAVEDRKEETLPNLIKEWIEPGTTISDCWKGYVNLSKHGYMYIHKTVNQSVEFVNEEGFQTNKNNTIHHI